MGDDQPGTREELRLALEADGLGPRQTQGWLDNPAAYLAGLVPARHHRLRHRSPGTGGHRRLIARLGDPVPDGVRVVAAFIREAGTYLLELTFSWAGGVAVRH